MGRNYGAQKKKKKFGTYTYVLMIIKCITDILFIRGHFVMTLLTLHRFDMRIISRHWMLVAQHSLSI